MDGEATNATETIEQGAADFNGSAFAAITASVGIPYFISLVAFCVFLRFAVNYNLGRTRSWLARFFTNEQNFKAYSYPLAVVVNVLAILAPLGLLLAWGIITLATLPPAVVGIAIIFCGIVIMTSGYAIIYWWSINFRMTSAILVSLSASFVMFCAFEVAITMLVRPFSYIGFSAVFVSLNVIPMIYIAYLNAPGIRVEFVSFIKDRAPEAALANALEPNVMLNVQTRLKSLIAYGVAIAFLIVHASLVVFLVTDPLETFVGFYTLGAVLVLDLTLYSLHHGNFVRDPIVVSFLMIVARVFLIICGARFWFLGHSAVYLCTSIVLGISQLDEWFPEAPSPHQKKKALLSDPVKKLLVIAEDRNVNFQAENRAGGVGGGASGSGGQDNTTVRAPTEAAVALEVTSFLPKRVTKELGFMKKYVERREVILLTFTLVFCGDLVLVRVFGGALDKVVLSTPHAQWLFGVAALILSLILPACFLTYRVYQREGHDLHRKVILAMTLTEVAVVGSGVIFFLMSGSYIVLACTIFVPPIVFLVVVVYRQWVRNDFSMFPAPPASPPPSSPAAPPGGASGSAPPTHRTTASASSVVPPPPSVPYLKPELTQAYLYTYFTAGAPKSHYIITLGPLCVLLCDLALAIMLNFTVKPGYIGWTISACLLIPILTAVPVIKYFNTFEINSFVLISGGLGLVTLVLYCVLTFIMEFGATLDLRALGLLFFMVIYPTLVVFITALYKWRDDKWVVSRKVQITFGSCFVVVLAFVILVMLLFDLAVGIGLLFVLLFITYVVVLALVWITNDFYLPRVWKLSSLLVVVLVIGLGIAIGLITKAVFIGFSVSYGCLFVVAVAVWVNELVVAGAYRSTKFQFSHYIFPVFKYKPVTDQIVSANRPVVAAYIALFIMTSWGVMASVFLYPFFIGFGITSLGLALTVMFTSHLLWIPGATFGRALQYVTPDVLERARKAAKAAELGVFDQADDGSGGGGGGGGGGEGGGPSEAANEHVVTCSRLLDKIRANEAALIAHGAVNDEAGNPVTMIEGFRLLFALDHRADDVFAEEQRFSTLFQFLTVMSAQSMRLQAEAQIRDMINKTGLAALSVDDIGRWSKDDEAQFVVKLKAYFADLRATAEKNAQNAAEAAKATAEREKRMREAEERRLLELARQHAAAEAEEIGRLERERKEAEERAERDREAAAKEKDRLRREELAHKEAEDKRKAEEARRAAEVAAANELHRQEMERQRQEALKLEASERERRQREIEEAARVEAERQAAEERAEAERRRAAAAAAEAERKRIEQERLAQAESQRRREAEEARQAEALRLALEEQRRAAEEKIKVSQAAGGVGSSSDVDALLASVRAKGGKYSDPEFPPSNSSLYLSGEGDPNKPVIAAWKRPEEFVPRSVTPAVFAGGSGTNICADDIAQGGLGDCWFLSALSVLAQQPQLVQAVFKTPEYNREGVYAVQFYKNGKSVTVVIDDQIPCGDGGGVAYASSKQEGELWVMLLEKAYAKLHHTYEAIEGGLVHLALVDLTGGASESISLDEAEAQRDIASGRMWTRLLGYRQSNYLMGCGSPPGTDTDVSELGIVQGHAYAMLDVQEVDGNKLLKLRNPWGQTEWTGDWSDKSPLWTKRIKAKVDYKDMDDGSFWISFEDFVINFRNVYVCRTFASSWFKTTIQSEWKGETAGGCPNFPTAVNNPQFYLTVTRPTNMFIVLAQEETRGTGRSELHIGFMVVNKGGKRVQKLFKGERVGSSGQYINRREVSCEIKLDPLATPYTIFPSTFNQGDEAKFSITIHSDCEIQLKAAKSTDPAA